MTTTPAPSIGRIVHYVLTEQDVDAINRRRADAARNMSHHRERADGSQVHFGNSVAAGDVFPLVITRVWSGSGVNGQVLLDGNDTLWVTSRVNNEERDAADKCQPGSWHWPPRV